MYLIDGELLSQKNWLKTQRFPAMTDSRFTSLVARDVDRSPIWEYDALLPSFPHRSCKIVQWGLTPLL